VKEISLHVLDVIQNSIEAGATRVLIDVIEDQARDLLSVVIADNGRGMSPDLVARVTDPFVTTRTTRRVGLGLPLLADSARQSGGTLTVASAEGEGTQVTATFGLSSIDRPPLGDMATTVGCVLAANPSLDVDYRHRSGEREFVFRTADIRERLDGVSFSDPAVYGFIREYIDGGVRRTEQGGDVSPR